MENKKIVITGGVRNQMAHLSALFANIRQIVSPFSDHQILIYENDSTDGSLEWLQEQKRSGQLNLEIISEKDVDKQYPHRTYRIAYLRNRLLEKVRREYASYHYLLMMDMDDVNSTSDIADTFGEIWKYNPEIWDVQTIHQRREYYDVWAFRKRALIEYDCWKKVREEMATGLSREEAYQKHVAKYQRPYRLRPGLIPVISAFGGAAIYKIAKLCERSEAKYVGILKDNADKYYETCEHVPFHESLGGRIFINPLWINKD